MTLSTYHEILSNSFQVLFSMSHIENISATHSYIRVSPRALQLPAVETSPVNPSLHNLMSPAEKVAFSADTVTLCEHINEQTRFLSTQTLFFPLLWEKKLSDSKPFQRNWLQRSNKRWTPAVTDVLPCWWCVRGPGEGVSRTSPWWCCWRSSFSLWTGLSTAPTGPRSEEAADLGRG